MKAAVCLALCSSLLTSPLTSDAQLLDGYRDDNGWPRRRWGPNASFVQEMGPQPLPEPGEPETNGQADNDYYFAGSYMTAIASVITLAITRRSAMLQLTKRPPSAPRRDLDLLSFNLPARFSPRTCYRSLSTRQFDTAVNDPRFGVKLFQWRPVQPQIVIRPPQFGVAYTSPQFTLASVNAQVGPGFDNVVSLKGISYNSEGGGNWMGVDYVQLNAPTELIPPAVFPWAVGLNDNGWPVGNGGRNQRHIAQENGVTGSPTSPELASRWRTMITYFAGSYTTVIAANGAYTPVGLVATNEEAAERAFAGADNDLRYHFNLPNTLKPSDLLAVSFDASNLDDPGAVNTDPRYGVEVYFNGVRVQPQIVSGRSWVRLHDPGLLRQCERTGGDRLITSSARGIPTTVPPAAAIRSAELHPLNPHPPITFPWTVRLRR
jgi:hypothetical protein